MNERMNLLQQAVDEVYEHPKEHEDLIVNLLITYFKAKPEDKLKNWVSRHTIKLKEAA